MWLEFLESKEIKVRTVGIWASFPLPLSLGRPRPGPASRLASISVSPERLGFLDPAAPAASLVLLAEPQRSVSGSELDMRDPGLLAKRMSPKLQQRMAGSNKLALLGLLHGF